MYVHFSHFSFCSDLLQSKAAPLDVPIFVDEEPPMVRSPVSFTAYDAGGNAHTFTPTFHHADYHSRFQSLYCPIEGTYFNKKPLHLADPSESIIAILTYEQFTAMSSTNLKALMIRKNVLVTGMLRSTRRVCNIVLLDACVLTNGVLLTHCSAVDFSAGPKGGRKSFPKNVVGTVEDLLESVKTGKKIVNGLEFPMLDAPLEHTAYTSDLAAWRITSGVHTCPQKSEYPKGNMCWGLAGSVNTFTFMHVDSNGYNTFLKLCGKKLWAFYCDGPMYPLSSIDVFTNPDFSLDDVLPQSDYGIEAVVLKAGNFLLMRANTPHLVYGIEACIIHGGHFYMMDLMQRSVQSLLHSFALSNFITNIMHHPSRALLWQMLMFCYMGLIKNVIHASDPFRHHLPDIKTMDGIVNLLSLAAMNFL
ncbi:hypothetical protein B0H34DRAFT_656250, partial [Crassisporium funariophilum]